MKLGDTIETLVKPIAKALDLSCLDDLGNLRPESTCAQRRNRLNYLGDSMWDFLWSNKKEQDK